MAEKKTALPSTPISYEAEQALLGSILMDASVAGDYTSLLREHDFAMSQNAVIFNAIFALNQENLAIDALTVADRLTLNHQLEKAGGMEYISKLVTSIPSTANAQQYYEIVKRDSLRRDVIDAGNSISRAGYESDSGKTALDFAERTVFKISEEHESSRLKPIMEASTAAYNKIKSIQQGEYVDTGIKSGFKNLDNVISSLPQGALCILAARPSVGKTAFALTLSVNAALKQNKTVAVFSLEMPAIQLVQRMMTTLSGVPFSKQYTQSKMDINDSAKLFRAHDALSNSKIYVDDNSYNTPADIISKCRRLKNTVGLDLVIIDYLQLMVLGEQKENRQQEVSTMSRMMKIFAKELSVPFLVLSQMSRGAEQRGDEPMLSDLRESGSIEQDADMVMFLHRPKKVEKPSSPESIFVTNYEGSLIKLLVLKNRNGKIGNVFFDWNGDMQTYTPIDYREGESGAAQSPIKVNTEITSLEGIGKSMSDSPFDDLKPVAAPTAERLEEAAADTVEIVESDGNAELYAKDEYPTETEIPF